MMATSNQVLVNGHVTANGPTVMSASTFTTEPDVFASPLPSTNRPISMDVSDLNKKINDAIPLETQRSENVGIPDSFDKRLSMPDLSPQNNTAARPNLYKKLENFKSWSVSTYKCTKQVIEEKIGTSVPTSDHTLDLRIESLKQMQKHYRLLLDGIKLYSSNLTKLVLSQQQLHAEFNLLGQQQPEIFDILMHNANNQRSSSMNGEKLLAALDVVRSALTTLVDQTMEDTMLTIRNMNMARLEFDAYRKEADLLRRNPRKANERRVTETLERLNNSENQLARLKSAVDAKLRLLHENRVRVMHHNMSLLYEATSAYYSSGEQRLNDTLKQFNVKVLQSFPPSSFSVTYANGSHSVEAAGSASSSPEHNSNLGQSYVHFPCAPNSAD